MSSSPPMHFRWEDPFPATLENLRDFKISPHLLRQIPPRIEHYSEAKSSLYLRQSRKFPNLGFSKIQLCNPCPDDAGGQCFSRARCGNGDGIVFTGGLFHAGDNFPVICKRCRFAGSCTDREFSVGKYGNIFRGQRRS